MQMFNIYLDEFEKGCEDGEYEGRDAEEAVENFAKDSDDECQYHDRDTTVFAENLETGEVTKFNLRAWNTTYYSVSEEV